MIKTKTKKYISPVAIVISCLLISFWNTDNSKIIPVVQAATLNAASCSLSDVNAAVALANTGDTVNVPAGNCTWSTTLSLTKSLNFFGAGSNQTVLTASGSFALISSTANNTSIGGFHLKVPGTSTSIIHINGFDWRVHNNILESSTPGDKLHGVFARGSFPIYDPTGLIDNNSFIDSSVLVFGTGQLLSEGSAQNVIYSKALDLGGDSVYIENNVFNNSAGGNLIDANYASEYVVRFNELRDSTWGYTVESHSLQTNTNRANRKWEVYGNSIVGVNRKTGPFFMRGGTGVIFDNQLSGLFSTENINFDNVRSFSNIGGAAGLCNGASSWDQNIDTTGWRCRDQIGTGPDAVQWDDSPVGANTQTVVPAYVWNNLRSNTQQATVAVVNGSTNHIKGNRDYYESNAAFNGTTGVGRGLTSVRPTTCTKDVAYWATDAGGNWNTINTDLNDGALYKCTSTDTWQLYYTPARYPHILATEFTPVQSPNPPPTVSPQPTPAPPPPSPQLTPTPTTPPSGGDNGSTGVTPTQNTNLAFTNIKLVTEGSTYFVIKDNKRYGVTNPGILFSYGLEFKDARPQTQAENALPFTETLKPGDGALVKKPYDHTVYLIFDNSKHGFTSSTIFTTLGYSFTNVLEVTTNELDALPLGSTVATSSMAHPNGTFINQDGTIFRISENKRYGIPTMEVYNSYSPDNNFNNVVQANAWDMLLPVGGVLEKRLTQ